VSRREKKTIVLNAKDATRLSNFGTLTNSDNLISRQGPIARLLNRSQYRNRRIQYSLCNGPICSVKMRSYRRTAIPSVPVIGLEGYNLTVMSPGKLAEIVLEFIEFLELTDDDHLDLDTAAKQHESIAAHLAEATPQERMAVQRAASGRLSSLLREPDEYGYSPRNAVGPEQRALLESIISGEAYGWPPGGAT
jgi:hypothetical protein